QRRLRRRHRRGLSRPIAFATVTLAEKERDDSREKADRGKWAGLHGAERSPAGANFLSALAGQGAWRRCVRGRVRAGTVCLVRSDDSRYDKEVTMALAQIKGSKVDVKVWTRAHEIESSALAQLKNIAALPWVFHHVAAMPDVH